MGNDKVVDIFMFLASIIQLLVGSIVVYTLRAIYLLKEDMKQELSLKQDVSVCDVIKAGFVEDMKRGENKFAELIRELKEHTKAFNQVHEALVRVVLRLDYLERRKSDAPVHPFRREADVRDVGETTLIPGINGHPE
jgi:hypothetical protein